MIDKTLPFVTPLGARVLLKVEPVPEKTKGGILITEDTVRRWQDQETTGILVAHGEVAFQDMCPKGNLPPIGSTVRFIKYVGIEIEEGGKFYRLVNDEDIYGYVKDSEKEVQANA